jgi:potassium efflux system protein
MRKSGSLLPLSLVGIMLFLLLPARVVGAGTPTATRKKEAPATHVTHVTVQELQDLKKKAEQSAGLGEEDRKEVLGLLDQALEQAKIAEDWARKEAEFRQAMRSEPAELAEMKKKLAQPRAEATPAVPPDRTLEELEQHLAEAESRLTEVRRERDGLDARSQQLTDRRAELPALLSKAQARLTDVSAAPTPARSAGEAAQVTAARRVLARARRDAVEREIKAYEKENQSYAARRALLTVRRDYAAREVAEAEAEVSARRAAVNDKRHTEAAGNAQKANAATREAAKLAPQLRVLAMENSRLAEERSGENGLADRIEEVGGKLSEAHASITALQNEFQATRKRLEIVGMSSAVGRFMRKQRVELPSRPEHERELDSIRTEISKVQVRLMELEDQRSGLVNIGERVDDVLAGIPGIGSDARRAELAAQARELLETKRSYLQSLIDDYNVYLGKLVDLETQQRSLLKQVRQVSDFIEGHVLWIRSAGILGPSDLRSGLKAFFWLLNPAGWAAVFHALFADFSSHPSLDLSVVLILSVLLLSRKRIKERLVAGGEKLGEKSWSENFLTTVKALVYTVLLAIAWPAIPLLLAWRLSSQETAHELPKALAAALYATSLFFLTEEFVRQVLRPKGLGERHFHWSATVLEPLRRWVRRFALWVTPLLFLVLLLNAQSVEERKESLGRFFFIAAMVVCAVFIHRAMSRIARLHKQPAGGAPTGVPRPSRWLWHRFAYRVALLLVLGLALLAEFGYYYTAFQLSRQLLLTIWLALVLVILNALGQRLLILARRALVLRKKREAESAEAKAAAAEENEPEKRRPPAASAGKTDLTSISAQARGVLRGFLWVLFLVGLWFIWAGMLPALGVLDRVELWQTTTKVTETTPAGTEGQAAPHVIEQRRAITLKNLLLAIVVAVMTVVFSRNIPGLLHMIVLQPMAVESGISHAITTLARYAITILGIVLTFSAVGIGWSHVQWMAAAVTVGLGFGLQEIFANFVSGLIILFERPVRLGDTVTVGDLTGTVTRIRIRATTILDWNRKELIVPNKEFITGQLVNWSLSDPILRVEIKVGIAYGSDTDLAHKVLLEVAKGNPGVLDSPAPYVVFQDFGDSTLDFSLFVFIPSISALFRVRDGLNSAVDRAFRKAGIEIAFPQRDIHIRSVQGAGIELRPAGDAAGSKRTE